MGKFGARVYVDEEEWKKFKQEYNASEKIRDFIRNVNGTNGDKEERIKEINQEIKELKNKIAEAQEKISNLQSEKKTLETELEEERRVGDQEEKFIKIAKHKMEKNEWKEPEHINGYWKDELDCSKKELWDKAKSSDLQPVEAKKA